MRWFWIDRFLEFHSGSRAVALKNTTLAEPHVDNYQVGLAVVPASLMIEGLAQTGGLLVAEHNAFQERVVLAKVAKAHFLRPAVAGETLIYTATVDDIQPRGAICQATIHCDQALLAEVELVFAHLDDRFPGGNLFEPADFLRMLRLFKLYEVGRAADGSPLEIPAHLLEAERAENGS